MTAPERSPDPMADRAWSPRPPNRRQVIDWHEVILDALCVSDNGNNPFYRDDDDTVALAAELAEVIRATLAKENR